MANFKQGSADAQVKVGGGKLYGVFVSSTSSGTFALYDSATASASDPKIAATVTPAAGNTIEYTVAYE